MAHDKIIDVANFNKYGFRASLDTTSEPLGSLRVMNNAQVTLRGGLAPRPGTLLLGSGNTSTSVVRGLYNFRKSFGTDEFLVKAYDDELEFISKDYPSAGWTRLKSGFTVNKEFGFLTSLVNTANQDYLIGCNRFEPYFSWTGSVAQLETTLVGGETTVTVDTVLLPDIYESKTANSSSATTLGISTTPWAASQWVNFYVYITSGTHVGKIRKITANTSSGITFDTLGSDPGSATFEIRKPAFPASGTIIYSGTTIAYTAIPTYNTLTVASAHAATAGVLVTTVPTEYPGAPRGNRFANYLGRTIVGNVRSALARDSGGALQGFASAGSVFVSKLNDPTDFSFTATRVAGEGDIIGMPYGGGDITDVVTQEDQFYALKGRYIEAVSYSQDSNDLAVREPLKAGIGSSGKTIRGADDIYLITAEKQFTSIGRIRQKDIKPQTLNIGSVIERFLQNCGIDDIGRGAEIGEKVYIPFKSYADSSQNDILLVYNRDSKIFEGIWDVGANFLEQWGTEWYYGSSTGANVYQMFYQNADVEGSTRYGIQFNVESHWANLTASKGYLQAMNGIVVEGWVGGGTSFTVKVWGDFATEPFLQFNFSFDETGLLDGNDTTAFIGHAPYGIDPKGASLSEPNTEGMRHFQFRFLFPFQYFNFFAYGLSSDQPDDLFEVTRLGLILKEDVGINPNKIKAS